MVDNWNTLFSLMEIQGELQNNLTIKIDNKIMFYHLSRNEKPLDEFIKTRTQFITQLINKRKLKINYELVDSEKNFASKLL